MRGGLPFVVAIVLLAWVLLRLLFKVRGNLESVECEVGQLVEMGLVLARLEPISDGE